MKKVFFAMIASAALIASGCGAGSSFVRATGGGTWTTIQIRDGLDYDRAWGEVLDVVAKRFEMDMISKDGGYARTNWIYTWNKNSTYTEKYRTRVVFKFSADRTRVDLKCEAEYGGDPNWVKGFDTRLLSTMKTDIMGVVGRTVM